jgi:hypothetical protein
VTVTATILFCGAPARAQTMTMPDGSKMDMKDMAPARKPAAPKAVPATARLLA